MSLFAIALRSIQQRGVASLLTMLSMALGVMLVVAVMSIHGVVSQSFKNNASLGYNVCVGAKGGQEQLILNTVFYLSKPVENIADERRATIDECGVELEEIGVGLDLPPRRLGGMEVARHVEAGHVSQAGWWRTACRRPRPRRACAGA